MSANAAGDEYRCTRPVKAGGRCSKGLLRWLPTELPDPRSCRYHLTDVERAAYEALLPRGPVPWGQRGERPSIPGLPPKQTEQEFRLALDVPPRCWFWPVPEDLDRTVPLVALREWQAGRCAMCGDVDALVEDHAHDTGLTRGWLCRSCNTREGLPLYRDNGPHVFTYYRRRPPTAILGLTIVYSGWGS